MGWISHLQVSTPTFLILTTTVAVVPSCRVPKSTLGGVSWKPLTTASGLVREMVRHLLLTGSSTDKNWKQMRRTVSERCLFPDLNREDQWRAGWLDGSSKITCTIESRKQNKVINAWEKTVMFAWVHLLVGDTGGFGAEDAGRKSDFHPPGLSW